MSFATDTLLLRNLKILILSGPGLLHLTDDVFQQVLFILV